MLSVYCVFLVATRAMYVVQHQHILIADEDEDNLPPTLGCLFLFSLVVHLHSHAPTLPHIWQVLDKSMLLCDLAGSERTEKVQAITKAQLTEILRSPAEPCLPLHTIVSVLLVPGGTLSI